MLKALFAKKKILKILTWAFALIFIVILAAAIFIYLNIRSSLPEWDGELEAEGIHSEIRIVLDRYGVPHIEAQNQGDLFFAVGFVHAQERLFQMDMSRRYISGSLSKLIGRQTIGIDRRMRKLQMTRWATDELKILSPEAISILESYSAGINHVIKNGPLPVEYRLLREKPELWKPLDTILIIKSFGWLLSTSGGELANSDILNSLGEKWYGFLRDRIPENGTTILPKDFQPRVAWKTTRKAGSIIKDKKLASAVVAALNEGWDKDADDVMASNAWVVDGTLTTTGKPILANDQHLPITHPTQYYQIHIKGAGFDVCGMSAPGIPFILAGHNRRIAWGVTSLQADVIDYMIVKTKPDDPDYYQYGGKWLPFEKVSEVFHIKGHENPEIREFKSTQFGPVITGKKDPGQIVAIKWAGVFPAKTVDSLINLAKAGNKNEFTEAISGVGLPHLSALYADVDGNIGYYPTGLIPKRAGWDGSLPLTGNRVRNWDGFFDETSKPYLFNPDKHYLISANNQIGNERISRPISADWIIPFRAQRIEDMLSGKANFKLEDMVKIQTDTFSVEAAMVMRALKNIKLNNPVLQRIFLNLQEWNRNFSASSRPALYLAFKTDFQWYLLADEIRKINRKLSSHSRLRIAPLLRALGTMKFKRTYAGLDNRNWWDNVSTPQKEGKIEIIQRALGGAEKFLSSRFTARWRNKAWREMHQVYFIHPLGGHWPWNKIFNTGPHGIDGGGRTVLATHSNSHQPYDVVAMPICRMIIDLADFDNSLAIKNIGQSGNPFTKRYSDESDKYFANRYNKMLYSSKAIEEEKEAELLLKPTDD